MSLFLAYLSVQCALLSGALALFSEHRMILERAANRLAPLAGLKEWPARSERLFAAPVYPRLLQKGVFGLLALSGLAALIGGISALLGQGVTVDQLPFGLPWLHWHVRLDALSGFFLLIIGLGVIAASLYGPGYVREYRQTEHPLWLLGLCTGLFVAGMELVLLADDAFFFVIAWELMSVSSYFLVAFQHERAANRRAAFLYLLMAEIGAIAIILGFGVLAGFAHSYSFDVFRYTHLTAGWGTAAFLLALMGFGMKAGLVPLHAWLPEAHPVAPSHISALMSGVMLKVAIYGLMRFGFDLLGDVQWQWGVAVLILGTASAVLGVLYAFQQNEIKRLLAYSSIENIGIIAMGLGLSMIFLGTGHGELGVIGLLAALYHSLNHSVFKNLLFLTAGSVLHQTHEHDLEHLGGLVKRMPKTAVLALIGCLAISALPPFNGFVSEWLTFQAALQSSSLESGILRSVIPVTAAVLAFTGAMAAATFAKFYGIGFLGLPRGRHAARAREAAHPGMLAGPALLAGLCVLLGVLPTPIIRMLEPVSQLLLGQTLPSASGEGWIWLTPGSRTVASYSALLVVLGLGLAWWTARYLIGRLAVAEVRRSRPWDCGFGGLSPRTQYTSTAFSQPIRRIFAPIWAVRETIRTGGAEALENTPVHYALEVEDRSWYGLYAPAARGVEALARRVALIQTGSVRLYIAYSFFTLLLLLGVVSG
ncbi:hydrogenase 4 subunit B [Methylocaldum sp. BRCS4]|jgi:hydrogenase-4 component B|uniref:hydrogenase 4 subunit B n=1 Tax=unclassified Methylocaldum TaxID=2622260 RepID=UPI000A327C73|nr:hydrogenase 4 subunit B [Methylocaldum sp. BRCS4]